MSESKEKKRARVLRDQAAGLCNRCREPRGANGSNWNCRPCLDSIQAYKRAKHGIVGQCVRCGVRPRFSKHHGLCRLCAKETAGVRYAAALRRRKQSWAKAGLCVQCGDITIGKTNRCRHHYLELVGVNAVRRDGVKLAESIPWKILDDIWEAQGPYCHYTGRRIELGVNAVLEHLKPVLRFPDLVATPHNLVWCCNHVNYVKQNFTEEEFVRMCHEVAERHDKPLGGEHPPFQSSGPHSRSKLLEAGASKLPGSGDDTTPKNPDFVPTVQK